ncbi:hypothetical protein ACWPKO_11335 [Coraliomargarita sp. W4R53]
MDNENMPNPDELLEQALRAPKFPELAPYFKVVYALRLRDMSWRNIAAWLGERGVSVSHTKLRDFYNDEFARTPEPVMEEITDEIQKVAELLMLGAKPITENDGNED